MVVGIDVFGGDYAPEATVKGAILAQKELSADDALVLIGDQTQIDAICAKEDFDSKKFTIVHTTDFIGMDEYPAKAFSQKPNASIVLGYKLLYAGKIDGFASAGNTGAMLVGGMHIVKSIPGIIRPAIAAPIPRQNKKPIILLDVGLNPDCKPDVLYQYGILGSLYSEKVYHVDKPRVGLFNIGEEEEKGNLLTKAAYQAMKGTKDFNFVGNIEGTQLFSDDADVLVCDGFVGNSILKVSEAYFDLFKGQLKDTSFSDQFNFEQHGGTPILGINKTAVIGHGVSNDIAIKNMILLTRNVAQAQLPQKIEAALI